MTTENRIADTISDIRRLDARKESWGAAELELLAMLAQQLVNLAERATDELAAVPVDHAQEAQRLRSFDAPLADHVAYGGDACRVTIDPAATYIETFAAIEAIENEIRELDPARGDELIAQARDLVRMGMRTTIEALEMARERARMGY
jgi:hypothetical protein